MRLWTEEVGPSADEPGVRGSCSPWFCRREFLIVEIGLLHENRVPRRGINQHPTINDRATGPSTNGRSSAFGALCLGSNPSGPAKDQWADASTQLPAYPLGWGTCKTVRTEGQEPRENHGYFSHADRQS